MRQNVEKKNLVPNLLKKRRRRKRLLLHEIPLFLRLRLNRPIVSRKLDFFLSFQKEKKFRLVLPYLSATEI